MKFSVSNVLVLALLAGVLLHHARSQAPSPPPSPTGNTNSNSVTGTNVVSAMILDSILGILCYIGFVLWRGYFPVYRAREILPGVGKRPPKLSIKGFKRWWSWLIPVWKVSDAEFLESNGLDSLVSVRILSFGIALFVPWTILGVGVLLPVNYTGTGLKQANAIGNDTSSGNLTYVFLRMTISNVENGSSKLWVHFVVLTLLVLWAFYIIVLYYEENMSLQHSLFKKYVQRMNNANHNSDPDEIDGFCDTSEAPHSEPHAASELEYLESTDVNDRVVKMMDPENNTLLAKMFRKTVEPPKPGELWPVRRPIHYTDAAPEMAGRYAVLVIDEPRKQFVTSSVVTKQALDKGKKLWGWFGIPFTKSKTIKVDDLQEMDETAERDIQSYSTSFDVPLSTLKQRQLETLRNRDTKTSCCGLTHENKAKEESSLVERHERFHYIQETFSRLYGDDFDRIIPVWNTEDLDSKIMKLYKEQAKIDRLELTLLRLAKNKDKNAKRIGKVEKKLQESREREIALRAIVDDTRVAVLNDIPRVSFIALFHSALAAQSASNINANPISWRGFHTMPCPDPENINYPALTRTFKGRGIRTVPTLFLIVLIMIFPASAVFGALSQLTTAICSGAEGAKASANDSWVCSDNFWARLIMSIITGIIPQLLLTIYQSVFLPIFLIFCAQAEGKHFSLSNLDLRLACLFFHWNVWNFFFGSLLGGTIISGLRSAIQAPSSITTILAGAISNSSNFFVNYVILRALTMTFFRLFYPHACVGMNIAQWFYVFPRPKTPRDFARANPLRNCRYSRDLGVSVMAIYVSAMTYACVQPFILPWALLYFCIMYCVYRYQQIYIYHVAYNSRGQMWRYYAHRLNAVLALTILFTGVMFLIKRAWIQGAIVLIGHELFVLAFDKYLTKRYDSIYGEAPVEFLEAIPRANIDPAVFVPPPLREGQDGWFLEWGKAWQFWGAPRYGY